MDFIAGRANRQSRSRNNDSLLTASLSKRGRACLVKALTNAITSEPQLNTPTARASRRAVLELQRREIAVRGFAV